VRSDLPVSCRLIRPNLRYWEVFISLFLREDEKEKIYSYTEIVLPERKSLDLKFYITSKREPDGFSLAAAIDVPVPLFTRESGMVLEKETKDIFMRLYQNDTSNLLGLFAPKWLSPSILFAMTKIAEQESKRQMKDFVNPVLLRLNEKERELQSEFVDVRRFWMKDVADQNVKGAAISGVMLQETTDYERYVRQMGGRLQSLAFKWNGVTILLSANGTLFTYTTFATDSEASNFFKGIIDKLRKIKLIE
jgi:hypothetical protein